MTKKWTKNRPKSESTATTNRSNRNAAMWWFYSRMATTRTRIQREHPNTLNESNLDHQRVRGQTARNEAAMKRIPKQKEKTDIGLSRDTKRIKLFWSSKTVRVRKQTTPEVKKRCIIKRKSNAAIYRSPACFRKTDSLRMNARTSQTTTFPKPKT